MRERVFWMSPRAARVVNAEGSRAGQGLVAEDSIRPRSLQAAGSGGRRGEGEDKCPRLRQRNGGESSCPHKNFALYQPLFCSKM